MAEPLVSVIIANYNYARFLPACIDSVLAQTHARVEIIVVDDGSTDNSREVLASYGNRVRVIFQENGGQAAALNTGVAVSSGDVIALLDADDGWYPHKLDAVLRVFTQNPDVLWLRHKLALVTEKLTPLRQEMPLFSGSAPVPPDPLILLEGGFSAGTSLVLKRELADRIFPVKIAADLAFDADDTVILARIFQQRARGYSLDAVLGFYRKHAGERFGAHDLPRLLRREADVVQALGSMLLQRTPSSAYKLRSVIASLEGARWWERTRLGNYLAGLGATARLWSRPKLLLRQVGALTFAFALPGRWVRKLKERAVPVE
jgi:glycosyltransferase involved in cell wall biosynthesis